MSSDRAISGPAAKTDYADLLLASGVVVALTLTVLFLAMIPLVRHLTGGRDFVVYWATGQQLVHHADPFDPAAMGRLEHQAGYDGKGSYYMRNPPWSLPLALPLGFIGARAAALPWSLLMAALLAIAGRIAWKMCASPDGYPGAHMDWLAYAFPPALQCVVMGQTSIFLLLGLVLFLRLHRSRPAWAGAALWLCTLKPHLFVPWAVALLAWIIVTRNYRVILGAAAAMAISCGLTWLIQPSAFAEYLHWAHASGISHEYIPCLAIAFRNLIDPSAEWLAFLPCLLASLWALAYFWRRRHRWDWIADGGLLILVSITVAPYCWVYDQCLAIPALLFAVAQRPSRPVLAALGALYLLVQVQPYIFSVGLDSKIFLWTAPAWLAWYLAARHSARTAHAVAATAEAAPVLN